MRLPRVGLSSPALGAPIAGETPRCLALPSGVTSAEHTATVTQTQLGTLSHAHRFAGRAEKANSAALLELRRTSIVPGNSNGLALELYEGMLEARARHVSSAQELGFIALLDSLGDLSPHMSLDASGAALFADRDALLGDVARQLSRRLVVLEGEALELQRKQTVDGRTAPWRAGPVVAGAAQFGAESYFNGLEYESRARWSPSSVPRGAGGWAKFWDVVAPYYATGDIVEGGYEVGYLPTWHMWGSGSGLTLPLAPLSWSREEEEVGARAGLSLLFNGRCWIFSRIEAGMYARTHWQQFGGRSGWLGGELASQLFYNHLRLSANMDAIMLSPSRDRTENAEWLWTIRLGAANFNGMLYWLARAL